MSEVFERADAFLLGRTTYEIFAGHWPRITDPANPAAAKLNALPKYVATKTLDKADWHNSTIVRDVAAAVARLKQQYGRQVQVHGSAGLAQTLLTENLIDEFNLLVYPVVLGTGKRLFGSGAVPAALQLVASHTTSTGVVINTFRSAGKPTYGSFLLDQ